MPSLDQWERSLRPQLLASKLIGEVDLAPADATELGDLFGGVIRRIGATRAFRRIQSHWPATYLVWLVATASEKFEGNNLWGPVCADLRVTPGPNWTQALGKCFETCSSNLGFEIDFLKGGGHRYVTPILGHSGVPIALLPRFFQDVIYANLAWSTLDGTPERIIAATLESKAVSTQPLVVQRFLKYGDEVSRDFVAGCLHLAREVRAGKGVPEAGELSISDSVIEAYLDWMRSRGEKVALSQSGRRFHAPRITLSPEQYIPVYLQLPAQPISATAGHLRHIWQIEVDGVPTKVPVGASRGDTGLETRIASLPIPAPWKHLRAVLLREDEHGSQSVLRAWNYLPSLSQSPALIFDPETRQMARNQRSVPAGELWFLLPSNATLAAPSADDDSAQPLVEVEEFPTPGDGWHGWNCVAYNLSTYSQVTLTHGARSQQIWVDSLARLPLIAFEGAHDLMQNEAAPLFVDRIPDLRINMDGFFAGDLDLAAWTLTLSDLDASATSVQRHRLSEIPQHIIHQDRGIRIALANLLPPSMDRRIVGPLRLHIAGPRRRTAELELRAVIGMQVSGLETLYLPRPDDDALLVTLEVTLPSSLLLAAPIPGEEHLVQESSSASHRTTYSVLIPATESAIRLQVRNHDAPRVSAQLSFSLPIRRLRWRLESNATQVDSAGDSAWQSRALALTAPELDQLDTPKLVVDFGARGAAPRTLELVTKNRAGDALSILQPIGRAQQGEKRFSLLQMRDAYHSQDAGLCRTCLVIPRDNAVMWTPNLQAPEPAAAHYLLEMPCLYVNRDIQIESANLNIDARPSGDLLRLAWTPALALRDLGLRIWSLTNPYLMPLEISLPYGVRTFEHEIAAGAVPAGAYMLEFIVQDPWRGGQHLERPAENAPSVAKVVVGDLGARADTLLETEDGFLPVANLLEAALLYQQTGDHDLTSIVLDMVEYLPPDASGVDLLNLLAEFEHEPRLKPLRIRLYQPKYMKPILADRRAGKVSDSKWRIYRKYMYSHGKYGHDTLFTLLDAPDMGVQSAAIAALLLEGSGEGLAHLQKLRGERKISLEDVASYLQLDDRVAARYLDSEENDGTRREILSYFSPERQATIAGRLVHLGNDFGVVYLVDLVRAGYLTLDDALPHVEADAEFAAEVLESLKSDEALLLQDRLLEQAPEALPTITEGSEVQTRFGWATIYRIESSEGKRLESLPFSKAGDGAYSVRLLPVHGGVQAKLYAPGNTLRFQEKALYECKECAEFVATSRLEVENHIVSMHHADSAKSIHKHTNTTFKQTQELRFRAATANAERIKGA